MRVMDMQLWGSVRCSCSALRHVFVTLKLVGRVRTHKERKYGYRLSIENKERRVGQGNTKLCNIPVYAKMKKMKLPSEEMVLEVNYMGFMAYSGPYKIVGKQMGDHDGDWEHITVRCTPDGHLIAGIVANFRTTGNL